MKTEITSTFASQAWDFLSPIAAFLWSALVAVLGFAWDVAYWLVVGAWTILSFVFSALWAVASEYVFPVIWPLFEPTFGPVVEHFQAHTLQLWIAGICSLLIMHFYYEFCAWLKLTPEERTERAQEQQFLREQAQAKWNAQAPARAAKAAKKRAEQARCDAEEYEEDEENFFAWKDQQESRYCH